MVAPSAEGMIKNRARQADPVVHILSSTRVYHHICTKKKRDVPLGCGAGGRYFVERVEREGKVREGRRDREQGQAPRTPNATQSRPKGSSASTRQFPSNSYHIYFTRCSCYTDKSKNKSRLTNYHRASLQKNL